ncbi:MAG: insulinase family protein [Gammaproteobacteria bacterium]|jgi:Zn-dependent M16 (insulinase) family peptidase|nr:insulinase family protein [Gammaproteobacteria bacterium]
MKPIDDSPAVGAAASAVVRPEVHPAFEYVRCQRIDSLGLCVEEYRHRRTGALHFHLAADHPENVFLVAFRTVPMDSTGVAHILEHTALCGSERYPVRDPFFMMIRRSLNTFMNAFTSSDWTAYPFASQNEKDFYNLMDVYLDAAFFARLDELDFAQEGHRLEVEDPADPSSPLVYKGVVFNEMKGAMSSPVSVLWQTLSEHLFPSTTYHYNSGGDPEHIPDLRYEDLKEFYRSHYHPSNAIFMTFGSLPAVRHQQRMEERALQRFERLDEVIEVSDEQRLSAPIAASADYALEEEDTSEKTHVVLGWLLGRSTELDELLRAHLLTGILLDNSASPLRHALETSSLGSAPSPLCGLEDGSREMVFVCGLEGSEPERAEDIERLVLDTLERIAREGVPQEQAEAALHQLELHRREIGGDGYPYGLQLILSALPAAIHRGDPVEALHLDPTLERLRAEVQDPDFVPRLVRSLLLGNTHRVRLTLRPDPQLGRRQAAEEAERLAAIATGLDDADRQRLIERAAELAERQARQDDPDILPRVGREDIPTDMPIPHGDDTGVAGRPLTFYAQGTNGLVYQQIIAEMPMLEDELLDRLPHYTRSLTEVGCGGSDYLQTQLRQDRVCGGINSYTSMRGRIDDVQDIRAHFVLSGKALADRHTEFAQLMRDTLESVRFDEHTRLRELVSQERARMEQSVTGQGHSLAMTAASSGMSPVAAISHRLRGLEGIRALKALDDDLVDDKMLERFADDMREIHRRVIEAPRRFLLVGEEHRREQLVEELAAIWQGETAKAAGFNPFGSEPVARQVRQMWITSTQVNFCARVYPTVPLEHADAPALEVLGPFLRNGFLHRAIREQGGAYGGGAGHDGDLAAFRFYSYRDPRLTGTLEDFDRAIDWLLAGGHSSRQLEEAILGVIGSIDKPGSPAGEAKSAFHNGLYGRTPEQRQRYRARVLAVTLEDLLRVAGTWLRPERASQAVITSPATLESLGALDMEVCRL